MLTYPRRRAAVALIALAASALGLAGCSAAGVAPESSSGQATTLKVATMGLISDGALMLGIEQGFFEAEGLQIETSLVANPPAGLAAAQSGQVDVAYAPSIPVLNALSQKVPIRVIQAADGYADRAFESPDADSLDDTALYASAKSGVTSLEELGGKTIAVPARNALLEVTITAALKDAGVDPTTINWVVLDFTSAQAALESGTVDAAGLVTPFTDEAAAAGATFVSAAGVQFFREGAVGLWVSGSSTVSNKSDAIGAFQRAIQKSNEYANAHPDDAVQAGLDYTKSSLTVAEATRPYWPTEVRNEEIERVNEKLVDLGFLSAAVDLDGVIVPAP